MAKRSDPRGENFFALCTYRRNGTAVITPLWYAESGKRWYAYTPERSWKVRRLLAEPRCAFAASDFAGNPRGPWRTATAEVVRGPRLRVIRRLLRAKYGNRFRLFVLVTVLGRALGHGRGIGLVLTPDPEFP